MGRNAPILLDSPEKPTGLVSILAQVGVNDSLNDIRLPWENDDLCVLGCNPIYKNGAVEPLVRNERLESTGLSQCFRLSEISSLAEV